MTTEPLSAFIRRCLAEDIGAGDRTAEALVPDDVCVRARIVAKAAGVAAGTALPAVVFAELPGAVAVTPAVTDGERLTPGQLVVELAGPARPILAGERTLLNLLGRLCGIATLTRRYVDAVRGSAARILDTRKTTPGLRALEKAAVRAGGGVNHRMGLYDELLVKENHLHAIGAKGDPARFGAAVARALAAADGRPVLIEVESIDELDWALEAGARRILLDNMTPAELAAAVTRARARATDVVLEASGGITPEAAGDVAAAGVDRISVGALTHSARALDLSLLIDPAPAR